MTTVDKYFESISSSDQHSELEKIRRIIHHTIPGLEEAMSYGMPGFKYKNQTLVWLASFKDHMSIFPTSGPIKALKEKLDGYTVSKGTIQFTVGQPLPESLIKEILLKRKEEIDEKKKSYNG